jgi:hypothetical protein
MSADQGRTWHEQAVASPDQEAFPFYAPNDGMYWFSVCVVNHQNKREPEDIYRAPPSQKILIDTLKPVVRIKSANRQGDDVVVDWEIQEDNPDWGSLKLEYRTPDVSPNQWTMSPVSPMPIGQTRIKVPGGSAVAVRIQLQDLAGNPGLAETHVPAAAGSAGVQLAAGTANPGALPAPTPPMAPPATSPFDPPRPPPPTPVHGETQAVTEGSAPATPGSSYQLATAPSPDVSNRLVASTDANVGVVPASTATAPRPRTALPALQMVNTRQLSIDYEVTKEGPSGIGKVELWMTHDDGKYWERFAENPNLKPPMNVELPGEGIYGFRLVLQSKAGRNKPPPQSGDLPEMRVELDSTPPSAQLFRPEPDPNQADGLILSWSASDRNLAQRPITLQWAEQPGKEWHTIVSDWPNDGRYIWKLTKDIPYLVYLRLTVHDSAGNSATAETPEPVCIDLVKPDGRILGILKGAPAHPTQAAEMPSKPERTGEVRGVDLPLFSDKPKPD